MLAIASPAAAQSAPSVPYDTLFEIPGLPERPFVELTDISDDGKVIVGDSSTGDERRAFRWTESGGMQSLGNLGFASYASAVSGEASVVAGEFMFETFDYRAFRWTERGGMQDLGTLV